MFYLCDRLSYVRCYICIFKSGWNFSINRSQFIKSISQFIKRKIRFLQLFYSKTSVNPISVYCFFVSVWYLQPCVKSVSIWSFSGSCFPAFGLNRERYGVSFGIQSECEKIRTRQTPNTDTFHAFKGIFTSRLLQSLLGLIKLESHLTWGTKLEFSSSATHFNSESPCNSLSLMVVISYY